MKADTFNLKVEDDGTITITTDKISPQQHLSAEQFMEWTAAQMGGTHTKVKRAEAHTHAHTHTHEHEKENT